MFMNCSCGPVGIISFANHALPLVPAVHRPVVGFIALSLQLSDDGRCGAGERRMRAAPLIGVALGMALAACAGRDPHPTATVQVQDTYADCTMIRAEIEANNQKAKQLADEQ